MRSRILILSCICLVAYANFYCGQSKKSVSIEGSKFTMLYIGDEWIFFQYYWGMEVENAKKRLRD